MKIMYCISSMVTRAGMEIVLYNKAKLLVDRYGYEVLIVTTDMSKGEYCFEKATGIRVVDLGVNYYESFAKQASLRKYAELSKKQRQHKRRLKHLIRQEKPDLIVSMGDPDEWILPSIHGEIPILVECHFHKTFRTDRNASLYERIRERRDVRTKARFDRLITLTENDRKAWNLPNAVCIPNFRSYDVKEPVDATAKTVIAVGRLEPQKGYDYLVEAWYELLKVCPEAQTWRLCIYGSGSEEPAIRQQIHRKRLDGKIDLCGTVSDMPAVYQSASILAMTSRFEGMPLAILEAMSFGVVPVAFDCKQGPSDLIQDEAGFLVRLGDTKTFATRLCQLIEDDALRKQMSENAFRRSGLFSKEVIMDRWNALFQEVLRGKQK